MPALLYAWIPGVQAGPAVADVVWAGCTRRQAARFLPAPVGQVPIYYSREWTGRPYNPHTNWNSRHRDIPSCTPLFPFGFGLSYTTFEISNLQLSSSSVSRQGRSRRPVT